MTKKFYKNEKFQTWFFSILYFLMASAVVVTGCLTFKKVYYLPIVVSGTSMWPTLSGGGHAFDGYTPRYNYGIADISRSSVNTLHRFDVVATYYPEGPQSEGGWGTDSDYKIKRVWGFPGETLNLSYSYAETTYTFTVHKDGHEIYSVTSLPLNNSYEKSFEFERKNADNSYSFTNKTLTFSTYTFVLPHKTFSVSHSTPSHSAGPVRSINKTLGPEEYFVMGDNWATNGSTDSYSFVNSSTAKKLNANYLQGRIICISSYVSYVNGSIFNEHPVEKRYDF